MVLRKIILEELYCKLVILVRDKRVLNESSKYIKCDCCDYSSVKHIMCKVKDSPHYKYVNGDKDEYINYMKLAGIYAGYGLEHGFDIFDNLSEKISRACFTTDVGDKEPIVSTVNKKLLSDVI